MPAMTAITPIGATWDSCFNVVAAGEGTPLGLLAFPCVNRKGFAGMRSYDPHVISGRPTIVAIPARNEAERIARCLDALAAQQGSGGQPLVGRVPFKVVVLINNTHDDTAGRIERWRAGNRLEVAFRQIDWTGDGNAGAARKAAMDWASAELISLPESIICTTDADSEVDPAWLRQTWHEVSGGADAVAGAVDFDPIELADLRVSPLRRLEATFATLQAQIGSQLDPEPYNPWPNHIWAWGASLAITASVYREIGGLPPVPLAEDRALVAALKRRDFKVRHSVDVRVRTSTRAAGRAPGGLADLISAYASGDDMAPCDAALEPVSILVERATCRRRLRQLRQALKPSRSSCLKLACRLRLSPAAVEAALDESSLGAAWSRLEAMSPALDRRRLFPSELPHQIFLANRLLNQRGWRDATRPDDSARSASAGLWSLPPQLAQ